MWIISGYWVWHHSGHQLISFFHCSKESQSCSLRMLLFFYFGGVGVRERDLLRGSDCFSFLSCGYAGYGHFPGICHAVGHDCASSSRNRSFFCRICDDLDDVPVGALLPSRLRFHLAWATLGRINSPL